MQESNTRKIYLKYSPELNRVMMCNLNLRILVRSLILLQRWQRPVLRLGQLTFYLYLLLRGPLPRRAIILKQILLKLRETWWGFNPLIS